MRPTESDHAMLLVVSVEGGPGTLQTILDSLQHSTPVVLAVGFGRATDALAFALERSNSFSTAIALEGTSSRYATSLRVRARNSRSLAQDCTALAHELMSSHFSHCTAIRKIAPFA